MADVAPGAMDVVLAGERMRLLADRALYWPARARLLVADLHLGKGDALRAAGIPVPSGGTGHDLARLDALMRATAARELWILGDFLHGPRHPRVEAEWRALLRAHPGCTASVVAGNHDRSLLPDAVGLVHLPDEVRDGPFRFRHAPAEAGGGPDRAAARAAPAGHLVCGHVHPVVRLPGLPGRHPAFVFDALQTILPAFSAFTGGREPAPGSRWIACAGGLLVGRPGSVADAGP
ncbi:MAG: ligase-associated DNA damage response endonuclease PdeM [Gammaproteobacteria bacterium]|jgi:DNA ligase-associated metallophosphoesterase|nr:ligase-associated DNA damage response endonuclease PdeM [Gammaproteobacteria bacterium]